MEVIFIATYVISDIHGQYDMFMELLDKIKLKKTDTLYVLGDVLDRGPHPIKTLRKLMEMSNAICMVGNHELMALEGLEFLMSDIQGRQRVFYLAVPVTAAEGDVIEAGMRKAASFDFYCGDTKNRGVNGYDMVTQLGSSIRFTGQTAGVENFEECVIVGQNLGLDPEKGVFRVELDVDAEHYYLEVRRVTEK